MSVHFVDAMQDGGEIVVVPSVLPSGQREDYILSGDAANADSRIMSYCSQTKVAGFSYRAASALASARAKGLSPTKACFPDSMRKVVEDGAHTSIFDLRIVGFDGARIFGESLGDGRWAMRSNEGCRIQTCVEEMGQREFSCKLFDLAKRSCEAAEKKGVDPHEHFDVWHEHAQMINERGIEAPKKTHSIGGR